MAITFLTCELFMPSSVVKNLVTDIHASCRITRKTLYVVVTIIGRAKRVPHWGVQSRFRVICIYITEKPFTSK